MPTQILPIFSLPVLPGNYFFACEGFESPGTCQLTLRTSGWSGLGSCRISINATNRRPALIMDCVSSFEISNFACTYLTKSMAIRIASKFQRRKTLLFRWSLKLGFLSGEIINRFKMKDSRECFSEKPFRATCFNNTAKIKLPFCIHQSS